MSLSSSNLAPPPLYPTLNLFLVKATVVCTETMMIVSVDKSTFPRLDNNHLRLNDAKNTACRLTSNSTHVTGIVPLNSCGTEIKVRRR